MPVKLFVGGLAFSTATDRLREAFARFGSVTSAAVMNDRETGRSRGFGFVEMATPEEADKAISGLNGTSLDGRTIRVDKATPRGSTPPRPAGGPGGSRAPYQDRRPSMGGSGGGGFGQRYADRGEVRPLPSTLARAAASGNPRGAEAPEVAEAGAVLLPGISKASAGEAAVVTVASGEAARAGAPLAAQSPTRTAGLAAGGRAPAATKATAGDGSSPLLTPRRQRRDSVESRRIESPSRTHRAVLGGVARVPGGRDGDGDARIAHAPVE